MARQVRETDLGGEVARLELQIAQENVTSAASAALTQGRGSLRDLEAARTSDENDKWLAYLDATYARQQAQPRPAPVRLGKSSTALQ